MNLDYGNFIKASLRIFNFKQKIEVRFCFELRVSTESLEALLHVSYIQVILASFSLREKCAY